MNYLQVESQFKESKQYACARSKVRFSNAHTVTPRRRRVQLCPAENLFYIKDKTFTSDEFKLPESTPLQPLIV